MKIERPTKMVKMRGKVPVPVIEVINLDNYTFHSPVSCRGSTRKAPISVEDHEVQKRRHKKSTPVPQTIIDLSDPDEVVEVTPLPTKKPSRFPNSVSEKGQSSKSVKSVFLCEICVEPKPLKDSFKMKGCSHSFCSDCMVKYVASKIQENILSIRCPVPKCQGVLEPEFCRSILPSEVFNRWCDALCESLILCSQKFYFPFKDCSAMLFDDGGVTVTESECPHCRRFFCAQCKARWHSDILCKDFQKLNENEREREDTMLKKLAEQKKWQKCPQCKFYVERSEGCLMMKCRCGF